MKTINRILMFSLVGILIALPANTQDKQNKPVDVAEYAPVGRPSKPKIQPQWNRFYDTKQAAELLKQLVAAHPTRAKLEVIGKSYGGRDLYVMTIGRINEEGYEDKPAFWIDGGIHANETQGVEVVLYTAWYLLEMDGKNEFITRLLNERTFYLMPMMSPDSRDAHFYEPNTTHSPRGGQLPVDDDNDGLKDEDGPDDLNKDGHITQMRIKDPNGPYKPHEEYPQLMVRVKSGEKGSYRLLGSEGFDNDGDGRVNEDGDGYYDPNRGWAWNWQPRYVQGGAYRYPFSVPENRHAGDFVKAHPRIAGAQSYHNTGGMILHGPGDSEDRYDNRDLALMQRIGEKGVRMLPGYRWLEVNKDLYPVWGGEFDWFYGMQGIYAFTNELFTPFNFFREPRKEGDGWISRSEVMHEFDKYLLFGDGVVKWTEVDHPQYGKVEVGGFKKNWMRQPPSFLLEEECHRNMAFTLYHADQMPKVKIQKVTARDAGNGLLEVDAIVENLKITPTRAYIDVRRKLTRPDLVSIEGENVNVIVGFQSNDGTYQRLNEQKRDPAVMRIETISGESVVYLRWLVKAKGELTVKIDSLKGGVDIMKVKAP